MLLAWVNVGWEPASATAGNASDTTISAIEASIFNMTCSPLMAI
jgi:hypothetical protein